MSRSGRVLAVIGPGMLVAATGVGAGDLATATFTGSVLGATVLWAVMLGGLFKFVLNEGLARWQLATGTTFLEGAVAHLGRATGWIFLPYLVIWTYFVGTALMSACGVALHALLPVFDDAATAKVAFGLVCSGVGLGLVRRGGFRLFERAMSFCVGLMFLTVLLTAAALWPGGGVVLTGLVPRMPTDPQDLTWLVALIGGVGGTVTVLCYGYWIRESGREGASWMRTCRVDLAAGYFMTVLFGCAMVIIGSSITVEGGGADLLVVLAERLDGTVGPGARWVFMIGAFAAVFSSLLGVWQAVPYLFADVWTRLAPERLTGEALDRTPAYRSFQLALATIPALGLLTSFRTAQVLYAVTGAAFLPLLAIALLVLNSRRTLVGNLRMGWLAWAGVSVTLAFFAWTAWSRWFM